MDTFFQITTIAIIAAICCCVIKTQSGSMASVLSMAACILILFLAFRFAEPIIAILRRLQGLTGLSMAAVSPMLKVVGIGILTQISSSICDDAGEKTLHHAVEISGTLMSLYAAMPLLSAVLDLIEEILRG